MASRWFVNKLSCLLLAFAAGSCIDAYVPEVIASPQRYLVVDGFLNSQGVTRIRLSVSQALDERGTPPPETRATLYLEEENGPRYALREAEAGTYLSAALRLDPARRYRLLVNTREGSEYASDYTPVRDTPPIERVRWQPSGNELQLLLDTRDPANATTYYRWEYEETWEIRPPYVSYLEWVNGRVVPRTSNFFPQACWRTGSSPNILLTNTTRLGQDVVKDYRLLTLPSDDHRLRFKYSLLVKQYAQTAEEYKYWQELGKNTENIGGLFDPLPTQLTGNVRCLNRPENIALGYVGVHSVAEKRVFITPSDLPVSWLYKTGFDNCMPIDTTIYREAEGKFDSGRIPVAEIFRVGYLTTNIDCLDCRLKGTATKPSFW